MASCQSILEEENFTRLFLLLEKPCLKLMRALFVRRLQETNPGISVDAFLHNNRVDLLRTRHGQNNRNKYFPIGTGTDLHTWDIAMLYNMTCFYCPATPERMKGLLNAIKRMRDKLCHRGNPCVSKNQYDTYRQRVNDFLEYGLNYLDDNILRNEIAEDVAKIEQPMAREFVEFHKRIHNVYQEDYSLREVVEGKALFTD